MSNNSIEMIKLINKFKEICDDKELITDFSIVENLINKIENYGFMSYDDNFSVKVIYLKYKSEFDIFSKNQNTYSYGSNNFYLERDDSRILYNLRNGLIKVYVYRKIKGQIKDDIFYRVMSEGTPSEYYYILDKIMDTIKYV